MNLRIALWGLALLTGCRSPSLLERSHRHYNAHRITLQQLDAAAEASLWYDPRYSDPALFYRANDPYRQALREKERKALDDDRTLRVKLATMKAHRHMLATNQITVPIPTDERRRR